MQLPYKIALILFLLLLLHYGYYYPQLPETLATHFGERGKPNGWMSKEGFLLFELVIIGVVGFLKIALPRYLKVPSSMMNIPNREYWLADERKEKTLQTLGREMGWVFVGTLALVISVNHLVYEANLGDDRRLSDAFLIVFIGFLAFIAVWMLRFLTLFKLPKEK